MQTALNVSAEARDLAAHAAPTHTPGPWHWTGNSLRPVTPAPDRSAVHTILDAEGGCGYLASNVHDTIRGLDADMALIAAAPTLLGLLQELMGTRDCWGNYAVSADLEQRLYAAISDATVAA